MVKRLSKSITTKFLTPLVRSAFFIFIFALFFAQPIFKTPAFYARADQAKCNQCLHNVASKDVNYNMTAIPGSKHNQFLLMSYNNAVCSYACDGDFETAYYDWYDNDQGKCWSAMDACYMNGTSANAATCARNYDFCTNPQFDIFKVGPPPTPPPSTPAERTCALNPEDCKDCSLVKLKKRMSCLGMWGVGFKGIKKSNTTSGNTTTTTTTKPPTVWQSIMDRIKNTKDGTRSKGENQLLLSDRLNEYLKENYPKSPFMKLNHGDPGTLIVDASYNTGINPLLLLGVAAATTNMGQSGPSAECGNPWRQAPTANNPVCVGYSGEKWYSYGKSRDYQFSESAISDQAERIRYTYADNFSIRDIQGFVKEYNKNNPIASGRDNIEEAPFVVAMNKLIDTAKGTLACNGDDDEGGGGECGEGEVPDMSDIGISSEARQVMIGNCDAYKGAAAATGAPWQALMAIHYREGGGNPDQSMKNGFRPLCNGQDSSCPTSICVPGDTLLNDGRCAMKILGDKAEMARGLGQNGDLAAPSDDFIKWVFYLYNGYTWQTPNDRAYVMSRHPDSSINDSNPGTFTIYAKLMGRF